MRRIEALAQIALLLAVLLACGNGPKSSDSSPGPGTVGGDAPPAERAAPPPPKDPPGSFRDGTKMVGTDIQPGTYRTRARAPGCYWTRQAGFSGELGDIIANGNETGPVIVTIGASDKGFTSRKCGLWTPDLSAITTGLNEPFGDGYFIVGTDIAPGTWRADAPESCYWARLRSFSGTLGDVVTNANHNGIVTIAATDKGFKSHKCGTWTKMK